MSKTKGKVDGHNWEGAVRLHSTDEGYLNKWMYDGCQLLSERVSQELPFQVVFKHDSTRTLRCHEAIPATPENGIGIHVGIGDEDHLSLLAFPRGLLLSMVTGFLGETPDMLEDRMMTPSEVSISQYVVETMIAGFRERWLTDETVELITMGTEDDVRRSRMFPPELGLVVLQFDMTGPFGSDKWFWLIPQDTVVSLFQHMIESQTPDQQAGERDLLEELVREMTAQVTVRLGKAELASVDLDNLAEGDVLLLDQRIREPLTAMVAGVDFYRVWAGRVGLRQAMQIETVMN